MKKTLLVTFSILFSLVASSDALETDTHELINEYIATHTLNEFSLDLYLTENLEFQKGKDEIFNAKKVWEWLKEGGRYEDKPSGCMPYWRSLRHFHNPLTDEGYGLWESSLQWSQEPAGTQECGHYSWHDVRGYFYTALTSPAKTERDENFAQTFRGLGQLMHLVQDLSVPAHTRDDRHILYNYEIWAKGKDENGNPNVDFASIAPIFFDPFSINAPNPLAAVPVANLFDTNQYAGSNPNITLQSNIGLSEYTNANFFSEDTIFRNFPYPSRNSVSMDDIAIPDPRYPSGDVLRKYFNKVSDGDTGYRVATVSFLRGFEDECAPFCSEWFYENAALDDEVYGDYATRLIPRAVGYSAGLLEYFFRGKFDVELEDGEIKITNKSEENMHEGTFELYYDNEQGQRQAISINSGAEVASLDPDEDTTITFDPPSDFGEDEHYIIVYRGALGNETDAVVGRVIEAPKPYLNWRVVDEPTLFLKVPPGEWPSYVEEALETNTSVFFAMIGHNPDIYFIKNNSEVDCQFQLTGKPLAGYQSARLNMNSISGIGMTGNNSWIFYGVHNIPPGWEILDVSNFTFSGKLTYFFSDGETVTVPASSAMAMPGLHTLGSPSTTASFKIKVEIGESQVTGIAVFGDGEGEYEHIYSWTCTINYIGNIYGHATLCTDSFNLPIVKH